MNNYNPTLYFIRGLPGAGKSTFASILSRSLGINVYEADWFLNTKDGYKFDASKLQIAHTLCQSAAIETLQDGYSCIVSNTSTTEKEVQVYRDIADMYGANFVSLIVENRHEGKSVHDVPEETISKMKNRFSVKL